jgi:hypothetical protein
MEPEETVAWNGLNHGKGWSLEGPEARRHWIWEEMKDGEEYRATGLHGTVRWCHRERLSRGAERLDWRSTSNSRIHIVAGGD